MAPVNRRRVLTIATYFLYQSACQKHIWLNHAFKSGMFATVSLWDDDNWREPVPKVKKELLLLKQKGKCARCRKSFSSMKVKPVVHHTGKSNQIRSMQLLCPNCHSKAHVIKSRSDGWGGTQTVVVRKKFGKKKTVKKKKKIKRKSDDEWDR